MRRIPILFAVVAVAAFSPRLARADGPTDPDYNTHPDYNTPDYNAQPDNGEKKPSDIGISATLGGGITGFTDSTMRSAVNNNVSGLWDLRVGIGSHLPIGIELGYVGTAADINGLTGTQSGTLVGTTAEGAIRYNVLANHAVNPFVFAGLGWQRYDIRGGNFTLSDSGVNQSDDSVVVPMGLGLDVRTRRGLVLDARGTFRANPDPGLVLQTPNSTNNTYAPMHTWEASAAVGYEF